MYKGYVISEEDAYNKKAIDHDYGVMLVRVMEALLERFDKKYPFVDTKLNLLTGKNFDPNDPVRGRNAVYGWIQGRGLEALAGHCAWFKKRGLGTHLIPHLEEMLHVVLTQVRHMWQHNGERLWFFMLPDGRPFRVGDAGQPEPFVLDAKTPYGFSDLFASKGMYAAAKYLNDADAQMEALRYIDAVDAAIWAGQFENDQVTLDPKNPVAPAPGRLMQGPYMIQIGTAAMLVLQQEARGIDMGLRLVGHELNQYVNLNGRVPPMREGDMWEANGKDGLPYLEAQGEVLSDPGHALEFVGLTLKFTQAAKASGLLNAEQVAQVAQFEAVMPVVLRQNFKNGFLGNGINKAYDLMGRHPMNTDLPWWNLPETMRAAILCRHVVHQEADMLMCDAIFRKCHNAFVQHFVRPDLHLMAYQTITQFGEPVDVIPATADADPGYHTGLSIIDVLDFI